MPRKHQTSSAAILAAATFACAAQAHANTSPQGIWLDNTGRGAVEIKPCGSKLCGHVVWVKASADSKGCGRQIIGDAAASGSKGTHTGWIYSPEDRKRYNVEISPAKDGRLRVVGYAGIRLFSKTMYWTRADDTLQRCGTTASVDVPTGKTQSGPAPSAAATEPAKELAPAAKTAAVAPAAKAVDPAPVKAPPAAVAEPPVKSATAPQPARPAPSPAADAKADDDGAQEPQDAPERAGESADASTSQDSEEDSDGTSKPGIGDLASMLDKVIKRTPGGGCKLDLPWVKVEFDCDAE